MLKRLIKKIIEHGLRLWGCSRNCKVVADCDGSCRTKVCPGLCTNCSHN